MTYALFWSGGKDSLLALDRARRTGLVVTHLVNIYEGNTGASASTACARNFWKRKLGPLDWS
jgi:diphthamide synthase (EF-2-diphthine--ammonia ligase)